MLKIHPDRRPAILAALLAVALYLIIFPGVFVYDDQFVAHLDKRVTGGPAKWGEYFTKAYMPGSPDRLFRPLLSFSFAFQQYLTGDRAWPMHILNTILYAISCALIAELARRLAGRPVAYVVALLFSAHPLHVEAAAYLVGRAETMCSIGVIGSLILFLSPKPMTIRRALAIWLLMLFALLSKEHAMLLPALLLAISPLRPKHPSSPSNRSSLQLMAILVCWTLAGYIIFREESHVFKFSWDPFFIDWKINAVAYAVGIHRWLVPFTILGRYTGLLFFPRYLTLEYDGVIFPTVNPADPFFYLGILTVIAWWTALIFSIRRRNRLVTTLLLCLAITYSIISNFGIIIGVSMGERLMYLPSVFFIILIASLLLRLPRRVAIPLITLLFTLAVLRTETYAWRWRDALRLYVMDAKEQPHSSRIRLLWMDECRLRDDYEGAAIAIADARRAAPEYYRTWYFSGLVAAELGHPAEADQFLLHAEKVKYTDFGTIEKLRNDIRTGKVHAATRPTTKP